MFKRNKKIIVISLFVLGFLWLLYSLLSARPEMVVDESLRVSETVDPELERIINMSRGHVVDPVETPPHLGSETLHDDIEDSLAIDANEESPSESVLLESSNSDVALLADQDGFIDLDLTERRPVGVVLLEGDEIIIDHINEELERFIPIGVSDVKNEQVLGAVDEALGSELKESTQDKIMLESGVAMLPEVDEKLMTSADAVSREYQASYKKLQSITEKLKKANRENVSLTGQFDQLANENRNLAQIIRDIDEKIKVLMVEN